MVMGGFPWPREKWKGNMADIVSRDELAKLSWIALTKLMVYLRSDNMCQISSQDWLEGESNIFP